MPRRNSSTPRRGKPAAKGPDEGPGGLSVGEQLETWRGLDYRVRRISGSSAGGPYRCPGCDHQLTPGVPHVVSWPADDPDATDRRHWHTPCWGSRQERAPVLQRSRNAPRY